jgi:hypothetical protein
VTGYADKADCCQGKREPHWTMMSAVFCVEAWINIKFLALAHIQVHGSIGRLSLLNHF